MSQTSPRLALPLLQPSQAQKHVTHNEALQILDLAVQLSVEAIDQKTPPATPGQGEMFALGTAPTGAWAGQDNHLAAWIDAGWWFVAPRPGWRLWDKDSGSLRVWNGAAWLPPTIATDNLDRLGVGTTADATNRLAVKGAATLLNHDGAGHQLKINKAAADDTASLLFQSAWTGHAEMGLAGDTAFAIKVSPDGAAWAEALRFDPASGIASGAAVQADPGDTGAGQLLAVGAFGLGPRVLTYDAGDDLDALRGLCALIGNPSPAAVPDGVPAPARSYVGLTASVAAQKGAQLLFDTDAGEAHFRTDHDGWGGWHRLCHSGNVTAPLAEGGVIERGETAAGSFVRLADGTLICTATVAVDVTSTAAQRFPFPAAFAGGRARIASSLSHLTADPNPALAWSAITAFGQEDDGWVLRLGAAGTSSDPAGDGERVTLSATGRWTL
jgi:hypothetical protein